MKSNTLRIHRSGPLHYVSFPNIDNSGVATCVFSTRLGGVSLGCFSEMNMSFSRGDNPESVSKNYQILCDAAGINHERLAFSKQTHTNNIHIVLPDEIGSQPIKDENYTDIDGLITNLPGVGLVTQYADCVPLAFCDPVKKVVATSHAGWRGTVREIGAATILRMQEEFGCCAKDILVGIGPSVMQCCYEVDETVMKQLRKLKYLDESELAVSKPGEKYMLNLQKTNMRILEHAGVPSENIVVSDLCTHCHNDYFHSHRASGDNRGNLALIIALK